MIDFIFLSLGLNVAHVAACYTTGERKRLSSTKFIAPGQSSLKMTILHCNFNSHTMIISSRHHLPLNPTFCEWNKLDNFSEPVWLDGSVLLSAEELTAFLLGKVNIDNQKFDIVPKSGSDIEVSEGKECILSGNELGGNSDID